MPLSLDDEGIIIENGNLQMEAGQQKLSLKDTPVTTSSV